jgi:hypothetical protein
MDEKKAAQKFFRNVLNEIGGENFGLEINKIASEIDKIDQTKLAMVKNFPELVARVKELIKQYE